MQSVGERQPRACGSAARAAALAGRWSTPSLACLGLVAVWRPKTRCVSAIQPKALACWPGAGDRLVHYRFEPDHYHRHRTACHLARIVDLVGHRLGVGAIWPAVTQPGEGTRVRRAGKTPPFRGPEGELLRGSIAEVKYLRIGGIDQWVMIRGRSTANPLLVVLHGGPGMSEMRFLRQFNAPIEDDFTVVYWDQRGTAKSFSSKIPRSSMTVERFVADLDELVEIVRARLGQEKVAIFGHSWGSLLGTLYAARFPEKVSLYIGGAQIADAAAAEAAAYALAVAAAKSRADRKALKTLRRIGPPPYDGKAVMTERTTMQRLDGQLSPRTVWGMLRVLFSGESSLLDAPAFYRGFRFSLDAMWAETSALDLRKLVPRLDMPVFFFLGRNDHWVPPETTVPYFEALQAPSKTLVWFEKSGHEMFVDEPGRFNEVMRSVVRPVLGARAVADVPG